MHPRVPGLVAALLLVAGSAMAEQLPDGVGTLAANGSSFSSEISSQADCDDYVFRGLPGAKATASVKIPKGGAFVPDVQFLRPGGSVATDDDGVVVKRTPKGVTATMTLDAAGWWKVRVLGADIDPDRTAVTRSTGAYTMSLKYTAPKVPPVPAVSASFKAAAAIDAVLDSDTRRFQGYDGQTFSAVLKVPKKSGLDPALVLTRPDGSRFAEQGIGTTEKTVAIATTTLDATGTWTLAVLGEQVVQDQDPDDQTTGAYTLQVKLGKPAGVGLVPDSNGQYRILVPAEGGALLSYTLSYTGSAPVFDSLRDPAGNLVAGFNGSTTVKNYRFGAAQPIGTYVLTFNAPAGTAPTNVQFSMKLKPGPGGAKRKAELDKNEPIVLAGGANPPAGGPGTTLIVTTSRLYDPKAPNDVENVRLYLGHFEVPISGVDQGGTITGTLPSGLVKGVYDVVVTSTTGQATARVGAFEVVDPPILDDLDPTVGTAGGGFPVTLRGRNFRLGHMGLAIDGVKQPVNPIAGSETEDSVSFLMPSRGAEKVTVSVMDLENGQIDRRPILTDNFEFVSTPAISRIVPSLTPTLGGDIIYVNGSSFSDTDSVYLERPPAGSGVFDEITATETTFVNTKRHQFIAPPRPPGAYSLYVQDEFGEPDPPRTRKLTYFTFVDVSGTTGLGAGSDGWTNAVADYDGDGKDDLFVARRGGGSVSGSSLTRVFRNNPTGTFTDVTSSLMPAPLGDDDWRADRIWLADVNADAYPDIYIVTNSATYPPAARSHVRILVNEQRSGTGPATDRVFRDRTVDLMAPVRTSQPLWSGGGGVADNWRGLDMWVGDVDKGSAGPPEILITHNELKEEINVGCGSYCASPYSSWYTYSFYWGGSRAFVWDKSARAGQGRYRFEHNFFPRKAGVTVPIYNAPVPIPICGYGTPCRGKFTPFTGKRIAVGSLDGDGKLDVAVLNDADVTKNGEATSALQVAVQRFNPGEGSLLWDVTAVVHALGADNKADTVAIGQPGYPDGAGTGTIVFTKRAAAGGGSVMRVLKFKPTAVPGQVADFEDITNDVLPPTTSNENWQAADMRFVDVDGDGDQDLLLVAPAAPGGTEPAFRVLRNEIVGGKVGVFRETLRDLLLPIASGPRYFEGDALAIGDVNDDDTMDYVITREAVGTPPDTRVILTKKAND